MKLNNNKYVRYLRIGLLAIFTVLVTVAATLHIAKGGAANPSIHAICPFGGLESLYQVFTAGTFISKIFSGTLILFFITVAIAILFRRSFCGLICPFGAIQEFFAKVGRLIFKKQLKMPAKIDRPLRYLKYIILVITAVFAWKTAGLWMAPYDPWSVYGHLSEGFKTIWAESAVGVVLLIVTIIGSMVYDRFFCKYLCPMGALYGVIGKISPFKIVRDESACISCGMCSKVCPVNIDVQTLQEIKSAECLNCQICVLDCPKKGALENKVGKRTLKPWVVIILVIVLFFGSILAFQAAGIYQMTPNRLAAGETIHYGEDKGYMSITEAADSTKTGLKEFYGVFKIPADVPAETKMKEIVNVAPEYNFEVIKQSLE
jgi:ferredoxin